MKIDIDVPDGVSGNWKIETFKVLKQDSDFMGMRALFQGGRGRIQEGSYKKLTRNGEIIMSNTPDEIRDFRYSFPYNISGSILINGLGLGVVLKYLLLKPEITDITIIENSKDVIKLVAPTYEKDKRVTIIHANCFEWKPINGKRYNFVWHDIWDNITSKNLPEMEKLHRKYGRRANSQASWCKELCKRNRYGK